jgi:arylsulfatase A-like enzyme
MRLFRFLTSMALLFGLGMSGFAEPLRDWSKQEKLEFMRTNRSKIIPRLARMDQPNIVLILVDDLGYGDLGCYGQEKIKTLYLDQMAKEGLRFTSAYAGSTVCAPSRSSLMTGQHTGHTRVRGNAEVPLQTNDVTVAEILQKSGYITAMIGKWGLGLEDTSGEPNRKGFTETLGYYDQTLAHNYFPESLWRNGQKLPLAGNKDGKKEVYAPDLFARSAVNFMNQYKQSPFFLYFACTLPHANNELGRKSGNGMEISSDHPYTGFDWPQPEKNKAAMITRIDVYVGMILDTIKKLNLDRQTIVIFTSDNGPHQEGGVDPAFFKSSGPLRGIKRDLYEGGIRVPAIVRWPGQVAPGTTSDFPWAFWDFLPTAAELAKAPLPDGLQIDGQSIVPTLHGKPQKPHDFLYWEFHEKGSQQAVRMGDWKAVRKFGGALELYDLKSDLGETNNVASAHPDEVKRIEAYLSKARTESAEWPLQSK